MTNGCSSSAIPFCFKFSHENLHKLVPFLGNSSTSLTLSREENLRHVDQQILTTKSSINTHHLSMSVMLGLGLNVPNRSTKKTSSHDICICSTPFHIEPRTLLVSLNVCCMDGSTDTMGSLTLKQILKSTLGILKNVLHMIQRITIIAAAAPYKPVHLQNFS